MGRVNYNWILCHTALTLVLDKLFRDRFFEHVSFGWSRVRLVALLLVYRRYLAGHAAHDVS